MPDDRLASRAREAAASFECKKDGLRQTQAGEWKLTLTVLDLPPWLMTAHMGVRLMAALVEIADDETPVVHQVPASGTAQNIPIGADNRATAPAREHRSEAAKERFKLLGEPEQMVSKCAMLCADHGFQNWLRVHDAAGAAIVVRARCGIESRSELASNPQAAEAWQRMVTDYDVWRGAIPEQRS